MPKWEVNWIQQQLCSAVVEADNIAEAIGTARNLKVYTVQTDLLNKIDEDSWYVEGIDEDNDEPDPGYDPRDAIMNAWDGEREQPVI
jgi:hypothetical protein